MLKKLILGVLKGLDETEKAELKELLNGEKQEPVNDEQVQSEEQQNSQENLDNSQEGVKDDVEKPQDGVTTEPEDAEKGDGVIDEAINEQGAVQQVEPAGNGVRVEDVVMRDELQEKLSAFEAKLDAIIKENEDLKNQNSELLEKYENKDFGVATKKGTLEKTKSASYSSYDDYSKEFI